jgi:hypothetical protein
LGEVVLELVVGVVAMETLCSFLLELLHLGLVGSDAVLDIVVAVFNSLLKELACGEVDGRELRVFRTREPLLDGRLLRWLPHVAESMSGDVGVGHSGWENVCDPTTCNAGKGDRPHRGAHRLLQMRIGATTNCIAPTYHC